MIHFQLLTPERVVLRTDLDEAILPTPLGEMAILPDHTPMVVALSPGVIRLRKSGIEEDVAISGGIVEIQAGSLVKILADVAERAHEMVNAAAVIEAARTRAEAVMKNAIHTDDESYSAAAASLQHELARTRVVMKHRHATHVPTIEATSLPHEDNVS